MRIYKQINIITTLVVLTLIPLQLSAQSPGSLIGSNRIADLSEKVGASVVNIDWERNITVKASPDPFEEFFGNNFGFGRRQHPFGNMFGDYSVPISGAGSGVIIDAKKGYILTNQHVIDNADQDKINITLLNGTKLIGKVIGSDKRLDIAVIQVKFNKPLPAATLGDSKSLRPGQWVIAIGNPYRFSNTVTFGIISALHRTLEEIGKTDLIQTDAAINPGNSGGPLIDMNGHVIGINVAIDARAEGIGFAIPINEIKEILDDLILNGKVIRPWLGVYMRNVDKKVAEYFDLPAVQGVLVVDVIKRSPAEKGAIKKYDIIKRIDGVLVKDSQQLSDIISKTKIKQWLKIDIWREGENKQVRIKIEEQP